jgi:hypothetical protein
MTKTLISFILFLEVGSTNLCSAFNNDVRQPKTAIVNSKCGIIIWAYFMTSKSQKEMFHMKIHLFVFHSWSIQCFFLGFQFVAWVEGNVRR